MIPNSVIDLPFGIGIDESIEQDILDPGQAVSTAENIKIDKRGSYQKRSGLALYTRNTFAPDTLTAGTLTAGFSVHEFDQSYPLVTDSVNLYDYSEDQLAFIQRGKISEVVVDRGPGVQSPNRAFIYRFDSLVSTGIRITVYTIPRGNSSGDASDSDNSQYSDVFYQLQDETTGVILVGPKFLAQVRGEGFPDSLSLAVTSNGYACVTAHTSVRNGSNVVTNNSLVVWTWNLNTPLVAPTLNTWFTVASGSGPAVYCRAAKNDLSLSNQNTIVYLYHTPGASGSPGAEVVTFRRYNPATNTSTVVLPTVLDNTRTGVGHSQIPHICYDAVGNLVWVIWRDSVNANWYTRVFSGTTFLPITTANNVYPVSLVPNNVVNSITSTFGPVPPGHTSREVWVTTTIAHNGEPNASIQFRKFSLAPGDTVPTFEQIGPARRLGVQAFSEPINYQDRWYQWVCQSTYTTVNTYGNGAAYQDSFKDLRNLLLVEVTNNTLGYLRPVANVAPRLIAATNAPFYPHLVEKGTIDGTFSVPIPVQRNGVSGPHIETCRFSFVDNRRQQSAPFGDVLALSGGCPQEYDGDTVHELGFLTAPQIDLFDTAYAAGPGVFEVVAGTYSCFAIWEHVDARGNVHQSGPSNIKTVTYANSRRVSVRAHPITITSRAKDDYPSVRLVVYRTRTNELTFYRDSDAPSSDCHNVITQVYWQQDKNILYYTQPGVAGANVFHLPPPSLRCLVNHQGALAGVAEDGRTIWFSGTHLPGEGAYFYNAFIAYVDDPGKITALATMDGRLYAFTETSIWVIDGPGFADNGEGGFGPPQRLTADSGCISERSVVVSPAGILYQTTLGISLLTRSGEIVAFGRTVEETLQARPNITSAVLVSTAGEVRFTCQSASGGSRILVWDYRNEAWYVHSVSFPVSPSLGRMENAAMVTLNGKPNYHLLYSNGYLLSTVTNEQNVRDNDYTFPAVIETAWIKVAGLQGFQRARRVQLMGEQLASGTAGIRMEIMYDYNDVVVQTREWNSNDLAVETPTRNILEVHLQRQKCTAIKVRITTLPYDDGLTQSDQEPCDFVFRGLRLLVAMKGKNPLPPKNRGR